MNSIKITKLSVLQSRIVVYVQCDLTKKYSNPHLSQALVASFPNLNLHKCKNSVSNNFADVIQNTSIPHVLEHLIIDSQIKMLPQNAKKIELFGFTQWEDENQGIAKIEVSYYDDLVALSCIKDSITFLNKLL